MLSPCTANSKLLLPALVAVFLSPSTTNMSRSSISNWSPPPFSINQTGGWLDSLQKFEVHVAVDDSWTYDPVLAQINQEHKEPSNTGFIKSITIGQEWDAYWYRWDCYHATCSSARWCFYLAGYGLRLWTNWSCPFLIKLCYCVFSNLSAFGYLILCRTFDTDG